MLGQKWYIMPLKSGKIIAMPGKKLNINKTAAILIVITGCVLAVFLVYQVPSVQARVDWRVERAQAFLRGVIDPVQPVPTAIDRADAVAVVPDEATPTASPTVTQTALAAVTQLPTQTPTPQPTATPLPGRVVLTTPRYELQDMNNCGPATLAMYLRYYGWEGDQFDINKVVKPVRDDRNVNIEELMAYLLTRETWLEPQYRVGGDIALLRNLIANGFPVVIEEGMTLDESYWPNDDRWAGHYLLLTGYDDGSQSFITQDSFRGADRLVAYADLDKTWKAFNRVYLLVYPPDQRDKVKQVLGTNWDRDQNRVHAAEVAQAEVKKDSTDSFAWFNLGSNMVYFEKYQDAVKAYNTARDIGLPQRMLRYQFGPFFAYFNTARNDDLLALTEYSLKITPNSEEAMLWRGWALYHLGRKEEALKMFQEALQTHPGYTDAQYALDLVQGN